jgi:hypothetical protein
MFRFHWAFVALLLVVGLVLGQEPAATGPSSMPATVPSTVPSTAPTEAPATAPTNVPSTAPTTEPTTVPATAPTSRPDIPADPSTPQGTLKLLSQATESGDTSKVRDLMAATSPQEQKLTEVLMERTAVYARFRQSAVKAFGQPAADQLTGHDPRQDADNEQRINQADVKIDGDNASLEMDGQPVNLVRVEGKWRLSLGNLTAGMSPAEIEQRMREIKMLSDVVSQTMDQIDQGQYKAADEVNEAIRNKLASAMLKSVEATTQPTTNPTSGPTTKEQ